MSQTPFNTLNIKKTKRQNLFKKISQEEMKSVFACRSVCKPIAKGILLSKTRQELFQHCKEIKLKGYSKCKTKDNIIKFIIEHT